ncbi:hypothetical protein DW884_18015 [Ruminococcus sp. AM40-10AC]|nr:hypothetical protein DW884_18015 [Ruminococcus sp. AM40-10AC]
MFFKARAFSILPSQKSGGKDKTMMNMMTGAVAINGGVGVMEIHQPQVAVSQMAASAAQAAEQVALNAHITLRELKGMIDTVVEKKLPTFKTLMEMNPVAVARTSVNGAKLTAYENGYAVYEVDSAHTVMAVERCGDYRYDFTDGTHQIVPAETFEDAEWSLRLLMEGEKRIVNATQDLLWEEEFDAFKEDALSYFHPCAEIINTLGLKQKKYDGYYYDTYNEIKNILLESEQWTADLKKLEEDIEHIALRLV